MESSALPYSRRLEFSSTERRFDQKLLFDETPPIKHFETAPSDFLQSFYRNGFVVIPNIPTAADARKTLEELIGGIDCSQLPFFGRFDGRVQLAKVDRIPVCHDLVTRSFQALHFDMGQPLVEESSQTLYLALALYRPPDATLGGAFTRVVFLPRLLAQRVWEEPTFLEVRLIQYTCSFGDGWYTPKPVNTLRLACFARILDAITDQHDLIGYIDKTTGDWFQDDARFDGSIGMRNENAFYRQCGLDLEAVEIRVRLAPNELLIVDNTRAVHGRFGKRQPQELHQFLYGVRSGSPKDIVAFRQMLLSFFTNEK
jgi:hypothetical protein